MISTRKNNAKSRELLKKELANLSYTQLCEVFNIIRVDTDKFTENNNGVFINLKFISDNTIRKVWDFIEFSKNNVINDRLNNNNKDRSIYTSSGNSDSFTMGKEDIQLELNRIKNIRNENFSFQNFLDRLSSNNLKSFPNDGGDKIHYPSLKTIKYKFEGTKARILKKCKDATTNSFESSFTNSLDINYCDEAGDEQVIYNQTEELEEDIEAEEEEGSDAELEEDEL